jgi:putative ABC transport system permease protein
MNWFRQLFSRRRLYDDLSAEIREHLDEKVEELVAGGMSRKEAPAAARREFGNLTLIEEDSRAAWGWPSVESFFLDVRFAIRALRKNPGFTTVAVLTLALGIGANSAIFSVVDAVLLSPLPYHEPDRLVTLSESDFPNDLATRKAVAPGNYRDWRDQNRVFTQVVAVELPGFSLVGAGRPERVLGAAISARTLGMLGLRPQLGREIAEEDDRPDANAVVMLSDSLWKRRFNASHAIIGQTIHLGTIPYIVVGVLPAGLQFPETDVAPPSHKEYALVRTADPQYFAVLGISLLRGRIFSDHDRVGVARAIVISESLARRYWPAGNPLGEHLVVYMGMDQSPWEIVGIVHDVRSNINGEPVALPLHGSRGAHSRG